MSLTTTLTARHRSSAFTLIELLTVIAIIGVLAAILIPTVGACRAHAAKTVELSAARQLMLAYSLATGDDRGRLMASRDNAASSHALTEGGASMGTVSLGVLVGGRWPHRLRPYLGDRFKNTLFVNQHTAFYDAAQANGGSMTDYYLSLCPSFGMNGGFVGHISYTDPRKRPVSDQPVQRLNQADSPSKLIVFVSAHDRSAGAGLAASLKVQGGGDDIGYFNVEAPDTWPAANLTSNPADPSLDAAYGFVAYRHGGKAVTGFLDGHVELKTCAEMRDMRLWSNQARITDNPAYTPDS
jgi:prepilin-type N-terminal cleavage/methylation domain-containing protein/prepilin-type processing-associated H-X9-DG protein